MCLAPSTIAIGRGEPSKIERQRSGRSSAGSARCLVLVSAPVITSTFAFGFPLMSGLFFLARPVHTRRNPGDKPLVVREAFAQDDHPLGGDFIFADVLAVVATAH